MCRHESLDLALLGVPFCGLLGVKKLPVDGHLEDTALSGDDVESRDGVLMLRQQRGRQTDGSIRIASDGAVLNGDVHGEPHW